MSTKHKTKSSSKFFKELKKLGSSSASSTSNTTKKEGEENKKDEKTEYSLSEQSEKIYKENDRKEKYDESEENEEISETTDKNTVTNDDDMISDMTKEELSHEEILSKPDDEEEDEMEERSHNYDHEENESEVNTNSSSTNLNIPIQDTNNSIRNGREKYFAVPYSASLEKEEQFLTSLGWDKQQYGYEDSDVDDEEWEITDEEKMKFYNLFKTLEPPVVNNHPNRKCLECSKCFACPFPCTQCGSILLESGGINTRLVHLRHTSTNASFSHEDINDDIFPEDEATTSSNDKYEQHHHVCQIHKSHHHED